MQDKVSNQKEEKRGDTGIEDISIATQDSIFYI